jgi:Tol biopolymer transport system component
MMRHSGGLDVSTVMGIKMGSSKSWQNAAVVFPLELALFCIAAGPAFAQLAEPERVSVSSAEEQSEDVSGNSALNADGRFVVFHSFASNLVAGDTNGVQDVFLRDRAADTTERVSLASGGAEADGPSGSLGLGGWLVGRLDISDDGRFVAFMSHATNLVPGDINDASDIFVRDRQTGTTERISVASDETQATSSSNEMVAISGDGRFVAFDSFASNLVDDDTNFLDVFLRDRQAGTTELVDISTGGEQGNGMSRRADVSDDGRFVVYESFATNLVGGDGNDQSDIFLRDRQAGTTQRISTALGGGGDADGESGTPRISADGRFIAFLSEATNLVAGDTNNVEDVFVYDREAGTISRVNVDSAGFEANSESVSAGGTIGISGDGRFVTFTSRATNLVAGDTNDEPDIFLHDRQTGETRRISLTAAGGESDNYSEEPAISGDGRVIGFDSGASNLVADDTNRLRDVFVVDLTPRPQRYEYVAKVVCGVQSAPDSGLLTPGMYATTINVHNPNPADVRFFKKLALTVPPGSQKPGRILPIAEDTLAYDEAMASECGDLERRLFPHGFPERVIEGYLVIQSPAPLDVDAVYTTAAQGPEGRPLHSSIDVERIAERDRAKGCDLEVVKEAELASIPGPPTLTLYFVLYTIKVTNHCDVVSTNVRLEDVVRTSLPATVALVVWPAPVVVEPAGTLTPGGPVVQPDGTLSVDVNGHIPALPAGDVGVFQFWATVLRYEFDGAPQHTQLIDEAEIESDLLEEDAVNNQASVSTNLF